MTTSQPPNETENPVIVDNWPMGLAATREQLRKIEGRIKRYQAALRLSSTEIDRRNRGITALTAFSHRASQATTPAALLKLTLTQALDVTHAPVGAIVLIDNETKQLTLGVHKGLNPVLNAVLTGEDLRHGATILMPHLVAGTGALLEYETDDEAEQLLLKTSELTSLVSLPIQVRKKLLGALLVGVQNKDQSFAATELCILMSMIHETAVVLENLQLREGLWFTAESLLGKEREAIELPHTDMTSVSLDMPATPFELPTTSPNDTLSPSSNSEDIAQLLRATVEADEEIEQRNADLQTLNAVAETVNRTLNLSQILQTAVQQTKIALQADAAWLYLVEKDQHLEMRAHTGLSMAYVRGMQQLQKEDSIEGRVAATSEPLFINSIPEDDQKHKIWVDKEKLHGIGAVPITRPDLEDESGRPHSHVIGVLTIGIRSDADHTWTDREVGLLTAIANQIAPTIENAHLYAQVQEAEAGFRAGNEVLTTLNDMLIEKNAFLEGFIEEDLSPALNLTNELLSQLNGTSLTTVQQEGIAKLQMITQHLKKLANEANGVSSALNSVIGNKADKMQNQSYKRPIRLKDTAA